MRRAILALLFALFAVAGAQAQSTTVTSTVTDTGGVVWTGGNYKFSFVGSQTVNWPGGAFNRVVSGTLDGTGSFSVSLPSTSTMTGGPASWTLQVTPITGISQGSITITGIATSGGTQPLTVTPNAIQIVGTSPLPVAAYADAEIIAPVQRGMIYYQVTSATAGTYRQCQGLTGNACTTWGNVASSGGGISSITTTSPITGGPITTTGTLACPTCVVGPSPGVAGQPAIYNGTNQIVSSMIYLDAAEVDTTVGHDICQRISTTLGTLVNNQVAYIYARPVLTPETCTVEPFAGLTATGTSGTLHLTAGVPSSVSAWKTPNFWWVEGNGRGTTIVADPSFADGANFAIIGDRGSDTGIASDRFDTGFRNMSIDCNSVVAITACVWSETAQEQAGLEHVLVKGCSTCIQFQKTANATPQNWHLDDLEVYPANVASAVGIDVDGGSSSLKTITDITILGKASDTNGLRINNARGGAVIGLHCEGLNDCVLIGDTGNDYGTYFANISGHSDVTTVVAIGNGGTQKGLSFSGLARLGATNLINDTYKTYLNQQDAVPFYSTGDITTDVGAIFNEGAQSNGDVHISVTSNTGSVGSKKLFLDGFYNNGATDFNVDSWTLNNLVNAGTNPATTLTFAHTGSSGTASVNIPFLTTFGGGAQVSAAGSFTGGAFISTCANVATSGTIRFCKSDILNIRNNAASANVTALSLDGNDVPTLGGASGAQASIMQATVGTKIISGADYTNATVTPSTVFSWTLPATTAAKTYRFTCDILWESTAATLVGPVFGVNISAAPTQLTAAAAVQNTLAGADINGYLSNTTTGSQTLVTSSAAGVSSTNYWAKIWGTIEGAPVAGSTFIINAASTSGTTASLNIRRGSGCYLN